ncbi:MAG: 4'-phosphopantetheinyl transferase superfamily protein [Bacteroidales bacterium]|nr:4'-phosphopantetheinyl transferase superfamily protein [Bacteroidales bacterium]
MSDQSGFAVPDLLKGEIHLWTVSIGALKDQSDSLKSLLSEEENRKVSFYKFEQTQLSYIVSQAVLRMLLSSYLDVKPADVKMGAHKKGKPYLIHDRTVFFNISNSHDLCVFAFSCDAEVGIDMEKIRDLSDIDQLIEKNLTRRERSYLIKDPAHKLNWFFRFWTFKESYLKAIGEGMRLTPENLEFSLEDRTIRLRSVNYGFDGTEWQFLEFSRAGNYTGALTYTGKGILIKEMSADMG